MSPKYATYEKEPQQQGHLGKLGLQLCTCSVDSTTGSLRLLAHTPSPAPHAPMLQLCLFLEPGTMFQIPHTYQPLATFSQSLAASDRVHDCQLCSHHTAHTARNRQGQPRTSFHLLFLRQQEKVQKKSSTLGWYLGFVPRDLKAHLTGGNTEIAQPPCRRARSEPGVLTHLFCPSSARKENLLPSRVGRL